ncbi:hypothetical protein AJ79_07803 [Helicocarpus griseus UAMH5409]|uniref:Uncharacterized protein n=1 Tax=Helicocarpus griseus UAMH5409 TaxID=1447875 RepID=A0A2B7WYI7_9EURO|nr:hypothetical protein AJ79_07803 [Helicocarpus griseus UAMH5409]
MTEEPTEARVRKDFGTTALFDHTCRSPVKDVPSPPTPVETYTIHDIKDRLEYSDCVLRNSQRRLSPVGTQALHIYKEVCAKLLDLEEEEGELEAAKEIWRATLRACDESIYCTPCLRVVRSSNAQILQDRLISLQETAFYARYSAIFAGLSLQSKTETGLTHEQYWAEINSKLRLEEDAYRRVLNGELAHHECPTYLAICHACDRTGFSHESTIRLIHLYGKLSKHAHINVIPLIKFGKFDDLKRSLYHDFAIIPLLTYDEDWKLIRLLNGLPDVDLYEDPKRSLQATPGRRRFSSAKAVSDSIVKKIKKRLRALEDEEKVMDGLSKTIGPLRPSGSKKGKGVNFTSSSQLEAERQKLRE